MEERGGTAVRAGAVHELLCDARALVPAVDELALLEAASGLRPATPDNTPRIGWTGLDGVLAAVGHYRNGILLAPLTAAAVVDLVGHRPVAPHVDTLAPGVSALVLQVNGEPTEVRAGPPSRTSCSASPRRRTPGASPSRSTAASSRARSGPPPPPGPARWSRW